MTIAVVIVLLCLIAVISAMPSGESSGLQAEHKLQALVLLSGLLFVRGVLTLIAS